MAVHEGRQACKCRETGVAAAACMQCRNTNQQCTLHKRLCIDKAKAIDLVLQGPVVKGVHDELAHTGMPAVQHTIVAVVCGGI